MLLQTMNGKASEQTDLYLSFYNLTTFATFNLTLGLWVNYQI